MVLCHSSLLASIYKEYSMLRFILLICTILSLSACSHFQFSTNLDKNKFAEYFQPSQVTIYNKNELVDLDYDVLGAVEGSSCQIKKIDPPSDIREARTNARINAAKAKANGIVFQSCITFEPDESCISNIICYGRALKVRAANEK
jgi:RcsF protein